MSRITTPSGDDAYYDEADIDAYISVSEGDKLTAVPRGWEPPPEELAGYQNRGRPEYDCAIRDAGWCPRCKELLYNCLCTTPIDLFDDILEEEGDAG